LPEALLTFLDGEVLRAETPLIDFHSPVLDIVAAEPGGNNREITVPLSSLKFIIFGGEEETEPQPTDKLGKVVIHFTDHDVMRAYADRNVLGGPHGVIYSLIDPERQVRRQLGVPYSAVKAIFKVKRWDSRDRPSSLAPDSVARILAIREAAGQGRQAAVRQTPLYDRTRRADAGAVEPADDGAPGAG
jgi:hypothetical protein